MNTFRLIQKSILLLLGSLLSLALFAQEQVYNFSFDTWSKSKGAWDLFPDRNTSMWPLKGKARPRPK